jgi:hypothetical protein
MQMTDTSYEDRKGNLLSYTGLVSFQHSNKGWKYRASALITPSVSQYRQVPFNEWWQAIILNDHKGIAFTRKTLVIAVAEQDGGIEVASGLDQTYIKLARKNAMGWLQGDKPLMDVELHSIREIAWECLDAIKRQYPQYLG